MKRLFIAIKIDPENPMLNTYMSIRKEFRSEKIRWIEPDKFHLTLKFLGDTYVDSIPIVIDVIESVFSTQSSFSIDIKNTGIFGSRYDPRVLWFGIEKCSELVRLTTDLIEELDLAGFKKDRQNFVPHLTIGRIKQIRDKKWFNEKLLKYREVFMQTTKVDKVILYQSILTKEGPIYKEINTTLLKSVP